MKKMRLLTSLFTLASLALALYFGLSGNEDEVSIENGLGALFCLVLFATFLSVRVSLINAEKINPRIVITAGFLVVLSTLQWYNSMWIETTGVYLLILLLILFGMSILTQLNGTSKFYRAVRFIFLGTLTYIAIILLLPERAPILFDIAFVLLGISSLGILVASKSKKVIS